MKTDQLLNLAISLASLVSIDIVDAQTIQKGESPLFIDAGVYPNTHKLDFNWLASLCTFPLGIPNTDMSIRAITYENIKEFPVSVEAYSDTINPENETWGTPTITIIRDPKDTFSDGVFVAPVTGTYKIVISAMAEWIKMPTNSPMISVTVPKSEDVVSSNDVDDFDFSFAAPGRSSVDGKTGANVAATNTEYYVMPAGSYFGPVSMKKSGDSEGKINNILLSRISIERVK